MKFTIEVIRDIDADCWVSHCLELDIISQHDDAAIAVEACAEAVRMTLHYEAVRKHVSVETAYFLIRDEIATRGATKDGDEQ